MVNKKRGNFMKTMPNGRTLNRLLIIANDFDRAGLVVHSYYIRLYVVQLLLSDSNKSNEDTKLAATLLNTIEEFKNQHHHEKSDSGEENHIISMLLADQDRAYTYFTNFVMSMYNENILKIHLGEWGSDLDLKKLLWCIADLFQMILQLWEVNESDTALITKRIKIVKFYLSQLLKGGLCKNGSSNSATSKPGNIEESKSGISTNQLDLNISTNPNERRLKNLKDDVARNLSQVPIHDDNTCTSQSSFSVKETNFKEDKVPIEQSSRLALGAKVTQKTGHSGKQVLNRMIGEERQETNITNINMNKCIKKKTATIKAEDGTISENNHGKKSTMEFENVVDRNPIKQPTSRSTSDYSELSSVVSRTNIIEEAQRSSKFAISALNYDDIETARTKLNEALQLLNQLK